jgi:superfamily II DNA or RNA helicase
VADIKQLREWQKSALKQWIDSNFRGIVEVATAGGKTFFALQCILVWLKTNPEGKILIIVPTTALQDQWYLSLTEDLSIPDSNICMWPEKQNSKVQFHVMVVNTARTKSKVIKKSSDKIFLIADECHRYASIENSGALEITAEASLGLTATAEREFDDGLTEVLIPNLGNVIYEYTIINARKDGVVSEFEIHNVKVPFRSSEELDYKKLTKAIALAFSQNDQEKITRLSRLRARVSTGATARIPAAVAIAEQNKNARVLIFHEEIEAAQKIFDVLKKRGHSVAIYHSQIGGDARRESLKQFRKGIVKIIVCCRALDEGVDVPESEVAIIAASTSSARQRIQRIGRVIRVHDSKEKAKIYTIYITDKEQDKLREEQQRNSEISEFKWYEMKISND